MLQQGTPGQALKYQGLLGTVSTVMKEEGAAALWKGLVPGLHRQLVFGGLRLGLYGPVKDMYQAQGLDGLANKVAAGLTTGAIGITVANPTDLVKVRLQSQGQGVAKYTSALGAYSTIVKEEGVAALWTGYAPNLVRNSVMSCVEVVGYDLAKEQLLAMGMPDGIQTHLAGGLTAGFAATCIANPVDVVKNRMMADKGGQFTGMANCFMKTFTSEGPLALYKGFGPFFARVGSFNVIVFVTLEQAKAMWTGKK